MTNQELHQKTKSVAKTYLQIEADLVSLLIEMDRRRAFRDLGYASLFQYCVLELKLSEAVTSAFITVSRKAAVVPDLMEALETQALTVSKAAKITAALDIQHVEESKQVIEFASRHSTAETEKWLKEKKGVETFHTLKIDSTTMTKLKKVRSLSKGSLSLEAALGRALDEYLHRHDPLEKAKRQRPSARPQNTSYPVLRRPRRALPASVKHFVIARDENRCRHEIRPGLRCTNTKFLEIHHLKPLAHGGTDSPANLTLLCFAHHQMRHLDGGPAQPAQPPGR